MFERFLGYERGIAVFSRYLIVILFLMIYHDRAKGQQDTLPPPARTSSSLITLKDFTSGAACGLSYTDMMKLMPKTDARKTIFNRQGSKFILPALFIAYGTAARFNELPIRQFDYDINHEFRKRFGEPEYHIDDYFQFGLPVLAYGLGFIPGTDSRYNFRDRTLVMLTSLIITQGAVELLKDQVFVLRPDGAIRSFPSGHTAITMMSAHFMFREYKDASPWIGVGGYLIATTTGVFRMVNNKHWFSDVVMGTSIGLLSVEVGYMMLPVWHSLFGIKDGGECFVAVPTFSTNSMGLGLVYQF